MEMSEFLNRAPAKETAPEELDVQKAVVESLAADKAEQDERIGKLQQDNQSLKRENAALKSENANLKAQIAEMKAALGKVGDVLANNADSTLSSKVTVLEREPEVDERFPAETRDQVLEVLSEARATAEKEGRIRRAQLLESVLLANEPVGNLAKRRNELTKLFNDNGNILSGTVIDTLQKLGIAYKNGEEYLLPAEIIKRTY